MILPRPLDKAPSDRSYVSRLGSTESVEKLRKLGKKECKLVSKKVTNLEAFRPPTATNRDDVMMARAENPPRAP